MEVTERHDFVAGCVVNTATRGALSVTRCSVVVELLVKVVVLLKMGKGG